MPTPLLPKAKFCMLRLPEELDRRLRARAKAEHRTLRSLMVELLSASIATKSESLSPPSDLPVALVIPGVSLKNFDSVVGPRAAAQYRSIVAITHRLRTRTVADRHIPPRFM